jgi:RND family efflux transporter MFP subunit
MKHLLSPHNYFPLAGLLSALLLVALGLRSDAAEFAGITEPFHDVTLSAPVTGVIGARLVEEGAFVKKGQPLVQLDKNLEELDVARKQLAKEMSQTELERLKALSEKKTISVSREELDKKQTEFKIAGVDLDLAREQLRKRSLVSPIDGYVTAILLDVGEGCETRQPIIRVAETRRCYFVVNIDAKAGHGLSPGQKLRLNLDAGKSSQEVEGTVSFVSPVIDPASGLMRVKLTFDNPDGKIRPGAAGRLSIDQ